MILLSCSDDNDRFHRFGDVSSSQFIEFAFHGQSIARRDRVRDVWDHRCECIIRAEDIPSRRQRRHQIRCENPQESQTSQSHQFQSNQDKERRQCFDRPIRRNP